MLKPAFSIYYPALSERSRTVDDASDPPQQEDDENGGRFLSLLPRHAAQEDDVDRERRYDDESVEYLQSINQ